jgi:hypothetical protein
MLWNGKRLKGAGQIIESDKTISVSNPSAIRSWERAREWMGRILPPSVVSYQEWGRNQCVLKFRKSGFFPGVDLGLFVDSSS